jgi:preprotein translocase subunit SecB
MADNGKSASANLQGQGDLIEAPLTLRGQYIKDFSFESPNAPDILSAPLSDPQINIDVNIDLNKMDSSPSDTEDFEVGLSIRADAKASGKQAFLLEITYAGVFGLGKEIPEEQQHPILMIECPRLLFPFARQIIATMTQDGGFMPLLLQPIDFAGIYEQQAQQMAQGGQGEAGGKGGKKK